MRRDSGIDDAVSVHPPPKQPGNRDGKQCGARQHPRSPTKTAEPILRQLAITALPLVSDFFSGLTFAARNSGNGGLHQSSITATSIRGLKQWRSESGSSIGLKVIQNSPFRRPKSCETHTGAKCAMRLAPVCHDRDVLGRLATPTTPAVKGGPCKTEARQDEA